MPTRVGPRSAKINERFLVIREESYIDCHKGIAHQLPKMKPSAAMEPAFVD